MSGKEVSGSAISQAWDDMTVDQKLDELGFADPEQDREAKIHEALDTLAEAMGTILDVEDLAKPDSGAGTPSETLAAIYALVKTDDSEEV